MHEHHYRSIAKGMSWRFFASIDTVILAYIFTRNIGTALSIGGVEILTKLVWYYFHERIWLRVSFDWAHPHIAELFARTSNGRMVLKALSWRLWGATDTIAISYLITRRLGVSSSIGATEFITKTFLYYAHEYTWLRIPWGTQSENMPAHSTPRDLLRGVDAVFQIKQVPTRSIKAAAGFMLASASFLAVMIVIAYMSQA